MFDWKSYKNTHFNKGSSGKKKVGEEGRFLFYYIKLVAQQFGVAM